MRTLIRSTTLALLCALALGLATVARAGIPDRPIDRPGGPPDPDPVMVGDPDQPPSIVTTLVIGRWVVLVHLPEFVWTPGRATPRRNPNQTPARSLSGKGARGR